MRKGAGSHQGRAPRWGWRFVGSSVLLVSLHLAVSLVSMGVGVGFSGGRSDAGREPLKKRGEGGTKVQKYLPTQILLGTARDSVEMRCSSSRRRKLGRRELLLFLLLGYQM